MRVLTVRTATGKLGLKIEPENETDLQLLTEFAIDTVLIEETVSDNTKVNITFIDNN